MRELTSLLNFLLLIEDGVLEKLSFFFFFFISAFFKLCFSKNFQQV